MADSRLTEVLRLCDEAMAREGDGRAAYLDEACGGDAALRQEVESLPAERTSGAGVIDTPPWLPDRPLLDSAFSEVNGALSPDGRWVAYTSNESGAHEVYLTA